MDWTEALELEVSRTGVGRYRFLCSDANTDAESRDAYRALMVVRATGAPPAPTPADLALRAHLARWPCCP